MCKVTVYDCSIVELPKIENRAGNITLIHGNVNVPFDIKRVFYSYDILGGEARGGHAHKVCLEFLIAASGSFEVMLDDGVNKRSVLLNRPFYGFHISPGIWAAEQGFSLAPFVWSWPQIFMKRRTTFVILMIFFNMLKR